MSWLQGVKVQPDPTPQAALDRTAFNGRINLQDAFIVIDGKRWSAAELLKLVADKLAEPPTKRSRSKPQPAEKIKCQV
jgi:hypothetical protein